MIKQIQEKVRDGQRISDEEALFLYQSPDLWHVGALAHEVNYRKNQGTVYYNINRHINPTNICVMSCKFCAFARKPGEEGAYAYSVEEILAKAKMAVEQGATEVHMVGGLHPRWSLSYYCDILTSIKSHYPDLHIKGFTAVEINWLARKERKPLETILSLLKEAGLGSLPGGGAEIFHHEIREEITAKLSTEDWLKIHRLAHNMGLHSNCTMLYGHVEKFEHRVYHLRKLRELQDETSGFNAFIPLSFQPHNNEMGISRYTFGFDDLKNLAVARIYLDNFNHIKSYWIMMGQDIAQLGLFFGANDLDGTVIEEKISRMAGGRSGVHMSQAELIELIKRTGHNAIERDTLYQPIVKANCQEAPARLSALNFSGYRRNVLPAAFIDMTTYSRPKLEELLDISRVEDFSLVCQQAANLSQMHHGPYVSFAPSIDLQLRDGISLQALDGKIRSLLDSKPMPERLAPSLINLDLAGSNKEPGSEVSLEQFLAAIAFISEAYPQISLCVSGIKGLWRIVQKAHISLGEAFQRLKEMRISAFQSSRFEAENELTLTELTLIHHAAHEQGLPTVAKVEITVPYGSQSRPMWEHYFQKILAFRGLQADSGLMLGLMIEPAKDSFMTPVEFIFAAALARLAAPNIPHMVCTLLRTPTLSPQMGEGSSYQRPEEKLVPVIVASGINDLGQVPLDKLAASSVIEEILAAGFEACLRDAQFIKKAHCSETSDFARELRHIPRLRGSFNKATSQSQL